MEIRLPIDRRRAILSEKETCVRNLLLLEFNELCPKLLDYFGVANRAPRRGSERLPSV